MTDYTRRQFLRRAVGGLGALTIGWLLAACGQKEATMPTASPFPTPTSVPPTPATTHTPIPTSSSIPGSAPTTAPILPPTTTPTSVPTATATSGYADLAVARGSEPEQLVRRALAALGGMERFVHSGDDVIIKPNICVAYHTYEYAATTNPWVVGALVKLCREAGARRVRVMDSPFGGEAKEGYIRSGIQEQVLAAGGEMEIMSRLKFVSTDIPQGLDIRKWSIYDDALKANVLIDVPIAKHHSLARLTLGMKNLMGLVLNRGDLHTNIGQRLADLTSRIRPTLTVVDAVRILIANGPTGGNLADVKKLDTVIVSPDIVAADSYASTLFGLQPNDLSYVRAAAAMGLGRSDLRGLKIEELAVAS